MKTQSLNYNLIKTVYEMDPKTQEWYMTSKPKTILPSVSKGFATTIFNNIRNEVSGAFLHSDWENGFSVINPEIGTLTEYEMLQR